MTTVFSAENSKANRKPENSKTNLLDTEGKNSQPQILQPVKIFFRHERKIKTQLDERKLGESVESRPTPNDILQEFIHLRKVKPTLYNLFQKIEEK